MYPFLPRAIHFLVDLLSSLFQRIPLLEIYTRLVFKMISIYGFVGSTRFGTGFIFGWNSS